VLAHHTCAIHNIVFSASRIVSCSDDMTVGVVTIAADGSLTLTKLFHGHVSRVRSIDVQAPTFKNFLRRHLRSGRIS
jgi:hypothetical protein